MINKTTNFQNPSYVIYRATSFLIKHGYPFSYVAWIFLIPQEYLPDEYSQYPFVWPFSFFRLIDNELHSIYHFIMDPNGTFLRFNIITYDNYVCCSNENNGRQTTLSHAIYLLYAVIIMSLVALLILAIKTRLDPKSRYKTSWAININKIPRL